MNRIALYLGGYVGGLILAQYLDLSVSLLFFIYALLFVFLLLVRTPGISFIALLLFCLLTGLLRYPAQLSSSASPVLDDQIELGVLRLEGRVLATFQRPDAGLVIDLELLGVEPRPAGFTAPKRLRLYIGAADRTPRVGSRLAFRSKIRQTRNFGVPGEFDYVRHLAYRRIWHTAYLQDSRGLAIFAEPTTGVRAKIDLLRQAGLKMLEASLDQGDAILLKGLLLGEKGAMPISLRQKLAAGGVSHLFAISGLHLGLLSFLLYALLRYIYSRSTRLLLWQPPVRVLWLLILPLLFVYLLLTGEALATRRAFMAILLTASLCLVRRRINPLNLVCTLAFLFLLLEPLALWQPSFMLSFSGVFGVLLWQKPLRELLRPVPKTLGYALQLFGISLAAFIATLPAVVFIFHLLAPAGLLCNLFAIPLVSFAALPLGLAGLVLGVFSPFLGELLLHLSAWVLQRVVDLAEITSSLPGLFAKPLFLTLQGNLALLVVCLSLLFTWKRRKALLLLPVACLLLAFGPSPLPSAELILFSVGQGEAILLRAAGKTVLIDTGGLRSSSFDVGERLLAPALGRLGITSLDAIVLSHDHPDHSGGLEYIVAHFDVSEFWSTDDFATLRPELRTLLSGRGVSIQTYNHAGWERLTLGGLESISLFTASAEVSGENNRSLALYLPTAAGGILLTGDLEARGVASLLDSSLPGRVSLLKVPHHGSRNSSPGEILEKLQPQIVIVSAGYKNSYHLPSRELLEQAEDNGAEVWRTDLDGTVRMRVVGQNWEVDRWRRGLFR